MLIRFQNRGGEAGASSKECTAKLFPLGNTTPYSCRDRDRHVVCINEVKRFRNQITLVLEYFEHEHFRFYFKKMELVHVQRYMKALLTALSHLHRDKVLLLDAGV